MTAATAIAEPGDLQRSLALDEHGSTHMETDGQVVVSGCMSAVQWAGVMALRVVCRIEATAVPSQTEAGETCWKTLYDGCLGCLAVPVHGS